MVAAGCFSEDRISVLATSLGTMLDSSRYAVGAAPINHMIMIIYHAKGMTGGQRRICETIRCPFRPDASLTFSQVDTGLPLSPMAGSHDLLDGDRSVEIVIQLSKHSLTTDVILVG